MASVESGAAAATANAGGDASIWGGQNQGRKFTKRHMIAAGAVAGAAILGLGLYFGLKGDSGSSDRTIITGQADVASEGCYPDANYAARTMTDMIRRDDMTTEMCNDHCSEGGYFYYGVQWGSECWCGAEGIDLAKNGDEAVCDMACAGDDTQICGGYWAFTAYTVGTVASVLAPSSSDCSGSTASVRFTSTTTYFEGGGCATLTDMYNAQGGESADGPLYVLDEDDNIVGGSPTGYWLIALDVQVLDGVTLSVHGTSAGGDADVLRIWSTSSDFYELRGYGGNLSFKNTKVTSWDTDNGEERTDYEDGRSFINCVTQYDDSDKWDCDGASNKEMGECRMDIVDSVMGNMGWFDAESYGLTWKVRGFCKDLSNPEIFDDHNVYGDISGSEIYGMYYGMYSYGHQGGVWTNNLMHDNILYGFDPHDDSDDLTISDNKVWNNGNHGIIASKRCNDVKIFDNEVWGGGAEAAGIFLHRSSDNAEVYNNYVHDMQDAGMALMESFDANIHDNTFENCKYGIRLSLGCADNLIQDNLFDTLSTYGLYTYMGSDDPDVSGNNGEPKNNVFNSNTISNVDIGIHIKEGEDNEFTGNTFTSVSTFEFEDSSGTLWTGNDIGGACLDSSTSFASGSDAIPDCPDSDE